MVLVLLNKRMCYTTLNSIMKHYLKAMMTTAFKNFDILGKKKYYFDIGGELTVHEVSNTLKRMKSHKPQV